MRPRPLPDCSAIVSTKITHWQPLACLIGSCQVRTRGGARPADLLPRGLCDGPEFPAIFCTFHLAQRAPDLNIAWRAPPTPQPTMQLSDFQAQLQARVSAQTTKLQPLVESLMTSSPRISDALARGQEAFKSGKAVVLDRLANFKKASAFRCEGAGRGRAAPEVAAGAGRASESAPQGDLHRAFREGGAEERERAERRDAAGPRQPFHALRSPPAARGAQVEQGAALCRAPGRPLLLGPDLRGCVCKKTGSRMERARGPQQQK